MTSMSVRAARHRPKGAGKEEILSEATTRSFLIRLYPSDKVKDGGVAVNIHLVADFCYFYIFIILSCPPVLL